MTILSDLQFHKSPLRKLGLLGIASTSLLLAACVSPNAVKPESSISSADISAHHQFVSCKQDGMALDTSAKQRQSSAQYLAAAKTLKQCLQEVDVYQNVVPVEERMQVHAITILDYFKGGDIAQARSQLDAFELAFPNSDLLFSDYTSFVDSMQVLLANGMGTLDSDSSLNINSELKSHSNRQRYWQTH